jgi:hypothetical protein
VQTKNVRDQALVQDYWFESCKQELSVIASLFQATGQEGTVTQRGIATLAAQCRMSQEVLTKRRMPRRRHMDSA